MCDRGPGYVPIKPTDTDIVVNHDDGTISVSHRYDFPDPVPPTDGCDCCAEPTGITVTITGTSPTKTSAR